MPVAVRTAQAVDQPFLQAHDQHISARELAAVLDRGRTLIAAEGGSDLGWLRWSMFWDEIPFMNMLFVLEHARGSGLGRALVERWEQVMLHEGHTHLLTSTLSNESAQHFYRRLGYVDCGCLFLPGEAAEVILRKELHADRSLR